MRTRYRYGDGTVERARELRRNMTPAERKLWSMLRASQLGVKFRKQQRLGPFYADFMCPAARLVIEIDGESHGSDQARLNDEARSAYLAGIGYRVLRFTNSEVMTNLEGVVASLIAAIGPSPSQA